MNIDEMRKGLKAGRALIQEEWADRQEIADVDQLIAEGSAVATEWQYRDNFQCQMRRITGK